MSLSMLCSLPRALEAEFWAAEGTRAWIRDFDRWGLATGIVMNILLSRFMLDNSRRPELSFGSSFPVVSLLLQIPQFLWVMLPTERHRRAYGKHRLLCTLIQRSYRLLMHHVHLLLLPFQKTFGYMLRSRRTFLVAALLNPVVGFLNAFNHPLKFTQQAAFIAIKAITDLTIVIPGLSDLMRQMGLAEHGHMTCRYLDSTMGLLANAMPPAISMRPSTACGKHSTEFVMLFAYFAVGVLLPLHLTYWCERHRKVAFLRVKPGAPQLQPWALASTTPVMILVPVLVTATLTWWICIVYAPVVASLE
jgi:hypothetical protein